MEVHGLESFSGEGMVEMIFFHSHMSIYNECFIYFTLYVGNFSFLSAVSFHCFLTDFDVNNFCTYYFYLIYKQNSHSFPNSLNVKVKTEILINKMKFSIFKINGFDIQMKPTHRHTIY